MLLVGETPREHKDYLLKVIKSLRQEVWFAKDALDKRTETPDFYRDIIQRNRRELKARIRELIEFKRWQKMEEMTDDQKYKHL